MIIPGSRQQIAALFTKNLFAPVRPIEPMESPCLPGFMAKKQAS